MEALISLIHPTRQRPKQAITTAKAWMSSAKNKNSIEYIFSLDTDDKTYPEIYAAFKNDERFRFNVGYHNSAIEAMNRAATISIGNVIVCPSDDFNQPPFHWDTALLEALEGKEDFLVKTQDGCQPWIITLPIMDRKYYERFSYIYHPDYVHMYSDTEMTHVGELLGKVIRLDMVIKHNHYSQKNGQAHDAINAKNDATYPQGEKLYKERFMRNFDLKDRDLVSKPYIHHTHMQWLKSKGLGYE